MMDAVERELLEPVMKAPWSDLRGFWMTHVFDDRFLVVYCVLLMPLLLLLPQRLLRHGIIATGLLFVLFLWGAAYAAFWLISCVAFYFLAEKFAKECQRTDVLPAGPPIAAALCIGGWYLAILMVEKWIRLPLEAEHWMHAHLPWLYSMTNRGWSWEPAQWPTVRPYRITDLFQAHFAHLAGGAYFVVRMLHYFSELKRNTIPREKRSLLNFLAFTNYAPSQMQGPIERYLPFQTGIDGATTHRSWRDAGIGLARIAWGICKSLIAALYIVPHIWRALFTGVYYDHPEMIESFLFLYFGVFFNIFWLYVEFSGYCDISAGISRILGYRQIENFDWPWLATSLRDFWRRWHISLSLILRDYLYIPLGGSRRGSTLVNLMLTFGICGIWHALHPNLFLWGLLMGLMLWVNQRWVDAMTWIDTQPRGLLPAIRRGWLRLWPLPQLCAWLLTMHAFVFSLTVFFGGVPGWRVMSEIGGRVLFALRSAFFGPLGSAL